MVIRHGDKIHINGDYQHQAYLSGPAPQRFWHYNKIRQAVRLIDIQNETKIIDAGCGSGLLIEHLLSKGFNNITAIDCNENAINFAQDNYRHPNITYILSTLDQISLPKMSFSTIFMLEVIEHLTVNQAKRLLKHFHLLLKPGGKLILSTPNRYSCWPLIEKSLDFFNLVPTLVKEQHEHLYSQSELCQMANKTGFTTTNLKTINALSPWVATLNWQVAEYINKLEMKYNTKWGNILLASFKKEF